MPNSLDPDQAQRFVGPDLGPTCLQRLSADKFVQNQLFLKNSFRNTIKVTKSLDPDRARRFAGPDLGPNCLKR